MPKLEKDLKYYRATIKSEAPFVDIKPYSHNIINLCLRAISEKFGNDQADKAIDDFGLEKKGWRKQG